MDAVIENDQSGWVTNEIFMDTVMDVVEENYIENDALWLTNVLSMDTVTSCLHHVDMIHIDQVEYFGMQYLKRNTFHMFINNS